jgi:hypothetical protein
LTAIVTIARIVPALLLPGAALLPEDQKGLNETYRGPIETAAGKTFAYVKLLDVKELINELVSSVLGRTLGLPIPPGYIVLVSRDDYPESEFLLTQEQDKALAFGVEAIGHPDLKRRVRIEGESVMRELVQTWTGSRKLPEDFCHWRNSGAEVAGNSKGATHAQAEQHEVETYTEVNGCCGLVHFAGGPSRGFIWNE